MPPLPVPLYPLRLLVLPCGENVAADSLPDSRHIRCMDRSPVESGLISVQRSNHRVASTGSPAVILREGNTNASLSHPKATEMRYGGPPKQSEIILDDPSIRDSIAMSYKGHRTCEIITLFAQSHKSLSFKGCSLCTRSHTERYIQQEPGTWAIRRAVEVIHELLCPNLQPPCCSD